TALPPSRRTPAPASAVAGCPAATTPFMQPILRGRRRHSFLPRAQLRRHALVQLAAGAVEVPQQFVPELPALGLDPAGQRDRGTANERACLADSLTRSPRPNALARTQESRNPTATSRESSHGRPAARGRPRERTCAWTRGPARVRRRLV